jgi:hypothetical protein
MGTEYADERRGGKGFGVLDGLAKAAGMTKAELLADIEIGGREAAFRRAAEKAERRKGDPRRRVVELLRRRDG